MPFRRPVTILLPLLAAFTAVSSAAPESIPAYKDGLDAMAASLWDIAALRFESTLAQPELDADSRRTVLLRLVETRIRAGESAAALKVLENPALAKDPELPFWKAQALITSGQYDEARALLDEKAIAPGAPHRREALFTRATLLRAAGNPAAALQALEILTAENEQPATVLRAKMEIAEIQLDQKKPDDALRWLPVPTEKMNSQQKARSEVLRARAELAKGETQAAGALFAAVLQKTDDPAFRFYRQDAAAGLAKAQLAADNPASASDGLLAFIQQERKSPKFGELFTLLMECLPEKPAPDEIILTRLREWCPPPQLAIPPAGINGSGPPWTNDSVIAWPPAVAPVADELGTQAMFHLALGLRRMGTDDAKVGARHLMARLRTDYPAHPLATRALLEGIRWDLNDDRREQAATAMASLEDSGVAVQLRAGASLTAAASAFRRKDYATAAVELDKASALLDGEAKLKAILNGAITRLTAGDLTGADKLIAAQGKDPRIADDLALERALYLTSRQDPGAMEALDNFIIAHPEHPRLAEARLAAAHAALEKIPPDLPLAKAQLESIPADKEAALPPASLALARIRLAARDKRLADAVAIAEAFLKDHPSEPEANAVRFELGDARYENKDYNEALKVLRQLAIDHPKDPLAPAALFRAARAAALIGTTQAQEESLALFDKLIASLAATKDPLADAARLEKARVQIYNLKRLDAAVADLEPWFKTMQKDNRFRVTTGLVLGEALYVAAGTDVPKLERTIALYENLLVGLPPKDEDRFKIEFRRGLTIEQLPRTPENSRRALEVYYSVLQAAAKSPPADWEWVDKCGANALALLEKQHDWQGAIGLAKKHAMLPSKGAKEAEARFNELQQEHFEWGDK